LQLDYRQWHHPSTNRLPSCLLPACARTYRHPIQRNRLPPSSSIPASPHLGRFPPLPYPNPKRSFHVLGPLRLPDQLDLPPILQASFPDLETSQPASLRGDASETFAFSEFFPDPAKPVVAAFSNQIYNILVAFRICTPFSQADVSASRGETIVQRGTPGSARAEAERRRALALKALDQRLHAATAGPSKPKPPPAAPASVEVQPQPNVQAPATMLGETSYVPDREDEKS
jgi:hypothetical protein